jgi:hypothetical protein
VLLDICGRLRELFSCIGFFYVLFYQDKSATTLCHVVAAWAPGIFCNTGGLFGNCNIDFFNFHLLYSETEIYEIWKMKETNMLQNVFNLH